MTIRRILDYTPPPIGFVIGEDDYSRYLTALSNALPISEIEERLTWSGGFEVELTLEAQADGLTHDDFSEIESPQRWRPGQQLVMISFWGVECIAARIEDYHYNEQTGVGSGQLVQILDLLAGDRPSEDATEIQIGVGTRIDSLVSRLLNAARTIDGVTVSMPVAIDPVMPDTIDVPFTSGAPVDDAQKLAGIYFQHLYVDTNETVRVRRRPTTAGGALVVRALSQVEWELNPENVNFAANKVIVTGAREYAVPYQPEEEPETDPPEEGVDEQGKQRFFETEEFGTIEEDIFTLPFNRFNYTDLGIPKDLFNGATSFLKRRKRVYQLFFDGWRNESTILYFNSPFPAAALEQIEQVRQLFLQRSSKVMPESPDDPVVSVTVTWTALVVSLLEAVPDLRDALFNIPSQYLDTQGVVGNPRLLGLYKNEILVESYDRSLTFRPVVFVDSSRGLSSADRYSIKDAELLERGTTKQRNKTSNKPDPRLVPIRPSQVEQPPPREEPQPAPDYTVESEAFKGECRLAGRGYSTFAPKTYIQDVGYLPSQGVADRLARDIAFREISRRDSRMITMPLPREWVNAGLYPLPVFRIHNAYWCVENPAITYEQGTGLELRFQGDRLGRAPIVPNPPDPAPYALTPGLRINPVGGVVVEVGQAIAPVQFVAAGGTAPYTFSGSVPAGLTLSSGGLLSGTPTAAVNSTYTITVTDGTAATATTAIAITALAPATPIPPVVQEITLDAVLVFGAAASVPIPVTVESTLVLTTTAADESIKVNPSIVFTSTAARGRTVRVNFGSGGPSETWIYYTPTLTANLNGAVRVVFNPTDFVSFVDFEAFLDGNGPGYYTVTAPNGDRFLTTFVVTGATTNPSGQFTLHTLTGATDTGSGIINGEDLTAVRILDASVEITINYIGS